MSTLLIAGVDTEIGKTVLTTALAAYWQAYCQPRRLGLMKPIQAGAGDREHYRQLFDLDQSVEEITPLFFEAPIAPPLAAEKERREVDLAVVWQTYDQLAKSRDWVLIESLGGLGSPITHELTVADLAADWRLPVVLVTPVKLGAIAQTVANVALARQVGVQLKGIVLNCVQPCSEVDIANWTPMDLIQSLTQIPILGVIPHLSDPTDLSKLVQVASNLDMERLLPKAVCS
ncbi:MAG: dethiobiotin synthase [Leptolyngbyaceae cyanobacterium MO_188.B28]|nr:dethiobiotin synthase [Leptolyngbyaceae cyanobacterium MO_188.B28]